MSVKEVWTKLDGMRTKTSNSVATKQKNRPGAAGEEAISYAARAIRGGGGVKRIVKGWCVLN
jgi:hypothetical protein